MLKPVLKKVLHLEDPVGSIKGIGPKKSEALRESGFETVFDLLRIYPNKYQDRRTAVDIKDLKADTQALIKVRLESIKSAYVRRGLTVISAVFYDRDGKINIKWFNKTYLLKQLKLHNEYWLYGNTVAFKNSLTISNPEIEPVSDNNTGTKDRLTAVYSSNAGLSRAAISPLSLRKIIDGILDNTDLASSLPEELRNTTYSGIFKSFEEIHRPTTLEALNKAKHTIAFFDQVLFQMGVLKRRENLTGYLTLPDKNQYEPYESPYPLPFELTGAQKKALGQIIGDMLPESDKPPMNRLVQGDVGSGKTLVAFLAMLKFIFVLRPGAQCAFMAPTEILANQHLIAFKKFFPQFASKAVILTGSLKTKERRLINDLIETGAALVVFGTHALFQEQLKFNELGLCIIDEQQRFGVNHRRMLFNKGSDPHQLLLSATPIPRTLSLTIFGDMDTSIIDEMPPGRQPVKTYTAKSFDEVAPKVGEVLENGGQVYVVCPLIEASDERDWTSVEESAQRIAGHFPDKNIACLTGQQSWEEKDLIMHSFKSGEIDIVIATTVVEVGVDNPNATLIVIENADCFGLSQLHQLRGRVGRGSKQSECILISRQKSESERLKILVSTNDGFELSTEDLKMRGPGDLIGTRQSGLSHPCFSHKIPLKLIENARKRAFEILTKESDTIKNWFCAQMIKSFGGSYTTFMEGG